MTPEVIPIHEPALADDPHMLRDEALRAAGVRIPTQPAPERRRFTARRRPWWLAALLRLVSSVRS